jgi:hypothetical protein
LLKALAIMATTLLQQPAGSSKEQYQASYGIMFGGAVSAHHDSIAIKVRHAAQSTAPQPMQDRVKLLTQERCNLIRCLIPAHKFFLLLHILGSSCAVLWCYRSYQLQAGQRSSCSPVATTSLVLSEH